MEIDSKWKLINSVGTAIAIISIKILLWFAEKNPSVSESYLATFGEMLDWVVLPGVVVWVLYEIWAYYSSSDPEFMEEEEERKPLKKWWMGVGVILLSSVIMVFSMTGLNSQILPIPDTVNEGMSINPIEEVLLNSWVPGWLEDFKYFFLIHFLTFLLISFFHNLISSERLADVPIRYWVYKFVACFPGSIMFMADHREVFSHFSQFLAALIFGLSSSMIYSVTGVFLPIAHILHNSVVSLGFMVVIAVGGAPILEGAMGLVVSRSHLGSLIRERVFCRAPSLVIVSEVRDVRQERTVCG